METQVSCYYLSSRDSWVTSLYTVAHAVVDLVSYSICTGFSDFFQVPSCASAAHCKAQLSIFAQVDNVGNAWVAGFTGSSLDGNPNAGSDDIFLMKFDAQGVHLWTRQRGGGGSDDARALQADGVRLRFRICSMEEKHGKTLYPLARSMF